MISYNKPKGHLKQLLGLNYVLRCVVCREKIGLNNGERFIYLVITQIHNLCAWIKENINRSTSKTTKIFIVASNDY